METLKIDRDKLSEIGHQTSSVEDAFNEVLSRFSTKTQEVAENAECYSLTNERGERACLLNNRYLFPTLDEGTLEALDCSKGKDIIYKVSLKEDDLVLIERYNAQSCVGDVTLARITNETLDRMKDVFPTPIGLTFSNIVRYLSNGEQVLFDSLDKIGSLRILKIRLGKDYIILLEDQEGNIVSDAKAKHNLSFYRNCVENFNYTKIIKYMKENPLQIYIP